MDPKISKKTQDTLGKIIKKPPLTDKLLSKPPFRFLHDIMTSVIKSTGVMKGLYPDADLNSENVKDKESKIAFLQKAIDFVAAASGKQLSVKPAKIVAGHEPEKTNEFLQALASAINAKVDNADVIDKVNNKGGSSKKEEKKEERSKDRDKSGDRRKRDDDKRSRERSQDKEKSRDKEDRHREKEDRHREKDEKHRDKEDRHKDKDRDRDRERDRENRHKSGRSRPQAASSSRSAKRPADKQHNERQMTRDGVSIDPDLAPSSTPYQVDSDILESEDVEPTGESALNATFAVPNPSSQMYHDQDRPPGGGGMKLIPRQVSTYREMRPDRFEEEAAANEELKAKTKRPKAARPRREHRVDLASMYTSPTQDPSTPYVSEEDNYRDQMNTAAGRTHNMEQPGVRQREGKKGDKKTKAGAGDKKRSVFEEPVHKIPERSPRGRVDMKRGPKTSTPKSSPDYPQQTTKAGSAGTGKERSLYRPQPGESPKAAKDGDKAYRDKGSGRKGLDGKSKQDKQRSRSMDQGTSPMKDKMSVSPQKTPQRKGKRKDAATEYNEDDTTSGITETSSQDNRRSLEKTKKSHRRKRRSREFTEEQTEESESDPVKKSRDKLRYRNDDYEHEKVRKSKKSKNKHAEKYEDDLYYDPRVTDTTDDYSDERIATRKGNKNKKRQIASNTDEDEEAYYTRKKPHGVGDRRKMSSFTSMLDHSDPQKREDEGKENDAPKKDMVNGDHKQTDAAPAKMQRPSSAKGSRRRMEGGLDSSDEDVPVQKHDSQLGEDDLPPQVQASRMARPSSARPAPPKRKDDVVHNEPAMRLGSGKPQNLIIDDGKDSDEDETFVVEESAPPPVEPETRATEQNEDEDDEDHGGLVKKIMETKKEYEQQRKPEIERPTISDAQRRKQREAVQREIDKLRSSIQTLTRSANPLGKIMDYVQEDLDSMQKELEKWKAENKEHGLALKREKAITDRAVEPLKIQLSEVDQAIKDQLDLIGAVKSNIIRNDQKIEKMLRTIAKS